MKEFLSVFALIVSTLFINGNSFTQQIQLTDPSMTPAQAVKNVLLGVGINAFNIKFNGSTSAAMTAKSSVRHFNNGGGTFPIAEGILFNTDGAPSANSDADLNAIIADPSDTVNNGVIIEFDFVPSGDTLSFDYMFASSEYSGFTCSSFNDVFGFFISESGINGPYSNNAMNIAIIPGSDTISGNPCRNQYGEFGFCRKFWRSPKLFKCKSQLANRLSVLD